MTGIRIGFADPQKWLEHYATPVTESGCWLWNGSVSAGKNGGYGNINQKGLPLRAHRASWTVFNGAIPAGLCVCHRCDVRLCINPKHLFLGTKSDNAVDMYQKGRMPDMRKTHCPRGHELQRPAWSKHGICPICRQAALDRFYARRKISTHTNQGIT